MSSRTKKSHRTVPPLSRKAPLRAKRAAAKPTRARKLAAKQPPRSPPAAQRATGKRAPAKPARRGGVGTPLGHVVVADLMTSDPATVVVTASAGTALAKLHQLDVRHLPVVDEEGALVGMLSDRDFSPLPHDGASSRSPSPSVPVSDLMSSDVVSVEAETSARELIETLLDLKVGALPVTDSEGALVGIVSYIDVLRGLQGAFD